MGSSDNQQANIATSIVNDAIQNVANYCSITCNNDISNENITIIGGNATISIDQSCSAIGAECMIKTVIDSEISNIIKNIIDQEQSSMGIFSLFGPSSSGTANITNSIKNQISQLIQNSCQQSADNSITNSSVFAQDANLNMTIGQSGNLNGAQCAVDTIAKLVLNNDVTNTVKQKQSSCANILLILIIVGIIIALIILFPLLRAISKRAASVIEPKGSGQPKKTNWLVIILVIVGIIILGVAIYFFIKHIDNAKK